MMSTKLKAQTVGLIIFLFMAGTAAAENLSRTNFLVDKLSCGSCLTNIEAELKTIPGAVGMIADLRHGLITVDHSSSIDEDKIASAITDLGYPAKPVSTWDIPEQNAIRFSTEEKTPDCGGGCCNATSSAWKELYNRYFGN